MPKSWRSGERHMVNQPSCAPCSSPTAQCHEHPQLAWHSMSMCVSYSNMRWYAARVGESSVIQVQALQGPAPPLDPTSNICQPASCQICCPSIDSAYVNTSELVDKHGLSLGQMKNNKQIYLSRRILTTQRWCCNLNLAATAGLDLASTTKNRNRIPVSFSGIGAQSSY